MTAKRLIAALLFVMLLTAAGGCANSGFEATYQRINEAFLDETGLDSIIFEPMTLTQESFFDMYGLKSGDISEYYGMSSAGDGYNDTIVFVKAKNAKASVKIQEAFYAKKQEWLDFYREIPINGSYERVKGATVLVSGNYVFFVCVGRMPEDNEAELEFMFDRSLVIRCIKEDFPSN